MKPVELIVQQPPAAHGARRGRLFRKYFLLILALVCGALLISGAISVYFSYQENKVALARVQHEKAVGAAARIEQFVLEIDKQLAFAALPQLGGGGAELRRIEFLKLLKLVPAVTDVAQIDARGREQLSESRLAMSVTGGDRDRSNDPAFVNAKPGQTWFSPVYFRKETEPYMSIAVRSGGERGPVTVAEVNLKFVWDVVTRIKIGERGKAYVVDASGHLVADPDIGLVLRKTDLSTLPQVQAALTEGAGEAPAMLALDLSGKEVLSAYAPIDPLGWKVFVEQPVSEVFATLDASILRTVVLMVAGLLLSAFTALWLARSMVQPIRTLQEGAQRIGAGELDNTISIKSGDELEALAEQFNDMTARLRESYAGLERKVEARTAELQETLDQQTATSEILRVISGSVENTEPVFDAIVESCARLFPEHQIGINLLGEDGHIYLKASRTPHAEALKEFFRRGPERNAETSLRLKRSVAHFPDIETDPDAPEEVRLGCRVTGTRAIVYTPMVSGGRPIGAIWVGRQRVGPFSDKQVALIQTFADQAVIAIENVRLFNETKESLERQTATADILRVISSSPSDVQPVFDTIARHALGLSDGMFANVFRFDGELVHYVASHNLMSEAYRTRLTQMYPMRPGRTQISGRTVLSGSIERMQDVLEDPDYDREYARLTGWRSMLGVPMVREGKVLGAIVVGWSAPGQVSPGHEMLLKTFADQAVIAIENVRLFNETGEALEQQTAISEILRVISSSPSDVKPVLEAVAERAARICDTKVVDIIIAEGTNMRVAAAIGSMGRPAEKIPLDRTTVMGRSIVDQETIQVADLMNAPESEYPTGRMLARKHGHRTILAVPLLRENRALGTILLRRQDARPFDDKHISLLKTFADQAAIAIENVRLFNETKEALEQQKASADVLEVISGSVADTTPVFDKILESCERLFTGRNVGITLVGEDGAVHAGAYRGPGEREFRSVFPVPLSRESGTGTAILERRVLHYPDVQGGRDVPEYTRRGSGQTGTRSIIIAPMLWEGRGIGAVMVGRDFTGPFSDKEIALLKTFADQAVIAIQNVRLFNEIQDKSHQLEIANQHKSDFLANMSHELRTPLNAIIGFSEVLIERMFGELNEKQADYLKDIHDSGKHLLSLINDILDLSKIEAGRMDLELTSFDLPGALANAMTLVRERAQRHGIALGLEVDPKLGQFSADERKFKQIVLNLLSNAVKFTPDGGRVDVRANLDTGKVEIAVKDTGVGIAPEDQAAVFEEFKQVGRDYTRKAEGTGLGLALTRRFVELHGGAIRLESEPGKGSTFTVTLPVRT